MRGVNIVREFKYIKRGLCIVKEADEKGEWNYYPCRSYIRATLMIVSPRLSRVHSQEELEKLYNQKN